jgi:hypothetical protein
MIELKKCIRKQMQVGSGETEKIRWHPRFFFFLYFNKKCQASVDRRNYENKGKLRICYSNHLQWPQQLVISWKSRFFLVKNKFFFRMLRKLINANFVCPHQLKCYEKLTFSRYLNINLSFLTSSLVYLKLSISLRTLFT